MNTNRNDPYLTTIIVSEYVSNHKLAASELPNLITTVHQGCSTLLDGLK